ncbi:hypothetical protein GGR56DRAFT_186954 [Xylariaceae sp. FL0804]|nr:hypothetical protein GGR56DRAFT_186954 [Xylariaceae sp. FL0804]
MNVDDEHVPRKKARNGLTDHHDLASAAAADSAPPSLTELETAEILRSIRDSEPVDVVPSPTAATTAAAAATTATTAATDADLALSLDLHRQRDGDGASYYWDASTMAPLNAVSAAAVARLRAYKPPPFPTWDRLPVTRRAAVLILLFADRRGDLRVVITMRAASLRSFSGHAAFPGGKADSLQETPYQIARREAWEEIGLPLDDAKIPRPFRIEPLCRLPCSLAKTHLAVRPCVAFLHSDDGDGGGGGGGGRHNNNNNNNNNNDDHHHPPAPAPAPTVDEGMIPRLDAKEVAAVFSAPLRGFLRARDEAPAPGAAPLPPGHWYDGRWLRFNGEPWRVHNFHVPVHDQRVTRPRRRPPRGSAGLVDPLQEDDDDDDEEKEDSVQQRFLVWGMTGRMLVDAARVAYGEEPEFEHNSHFGDEALIRRLEDAGQLPEKKRSGHEVGLDATKEEVKDAKM